jgi:hypothetical protein
MVIFDTEMHQNGFFFRNLHEKLGKEILWKNFFFGHIGVLYGIKSGPIRKSTISPKMVQNRQF